MVKKRTFYWGAFCAGAFLLSRGSLLAFNSVQLVTVSAGVTLTQGSPNPPPSSQGPHLAHTPATHAYPVSSLFQVGGIASQKPVSLSSPSFGIFKLAPGGDTFQVQLSYKLADSNQVATDTQKGQDPLQFVFNVPKSIVAAAVGSGLMYRLDVKNVNTNRTTAFPSSDPTRFQFVSVGPVTADVTSAGATIFFPTGVLDKNFKYVNSIIDIPAGAVNSSVRFTMDEISMLGTPSNAVPSASGNRFALDRNPQAYRINTEPNVEFQKPVTVTAWYPTNGPGPLGGPPLAPGVLFDESTLATFVYDPFTGQWRPASATQDISQHTFTTRVLRLDPSGSLIGIFPSVPIQPEDFRPPQKIITPNGDGVNDTLQFGNLDPDATIDIYDVTGRRVRHLQGVFVWDGRDDSASVVESGVYIYQYKLNGKLVSGVVAVAK